MKTYRLSWHAVVHEISYANLILLSSVIPDYNSHTTDGETTGTLHLRADDPANADRIKQLLEIRS